MGRGALFSMSSVALDHWTSAVMRLDMAAAFSSTTDASLCRAVPRVQASLMKLALPIRACRGFLQGPGVQLFKLEAMVTAGVRVRQRESVSARE